MKKDDILGKFNILTDAEKLSLVTELLDKIEHNEELINYYKSIIFGKKSEKNKDLNPEDYPTLFNELEVEQAIEELEEKTETVKEYTRNKSRSKNLVNEDHNFDVEIINHEADNLICSECGKEMKYIGFDIRRELCYQPERYFIKEHRYFKYACECQNMNQVEREIIPFPNSMYSSSLVAKFIYDKFALSLPFYRQEQAFNDIGINITRSNISHYMNRACELLQPLYDKYAEILKKEDIVHSDETKLRVLSVKNQKGEIKTNYVWLFRSSLASNKQITYYYFNDGRKYHTAQEFFVNNTDKTKYIIADGYGVYDKLPGYRLVSCWAHARRKFVDVIKSTDNKTSQKFKIAMKFINKIKELYKCEENYKVNNLSYEEIKIKRKEEELPLIEEYFKLLDEYSLKFTPSSKMGKAITYSLERKESLITYLEDGRIAIDNNECEHLAKAYCVGRNNWLFCETEKGAYNSSMLYTIVRTAIANNLKPEAYLNWLLENISTTKLSEIENLAPWSNMIPLELKRTTQMSD